MRTKELLRRVEVETETYECLAKLFRHLDPALPDANLPPYFQFWKTPGSVFGVKLIEAGRLHWVHQHRSGRAVQCGRGTGGPRGARLAGESHNTELPLSTPHKQQKVRLGGWDMVQAFPRLW